MMTPQERESARQLALEQSGPRDSFTGPGSWSLDISGLAPDEILAVHRLTSGPLETDRDIMNHPTVKLSSREVDDHARWRVLHDVSQTHPIARQTDHYYFLERTPWDGDANLLSQRLLEEIGKLLDTDIERAKEIFSGFVNSPLPEDRAMPFLVRAGNAPVKLVKIDHDYGLTLWDQLIRDTDKRIRDAAESLLQVELGMAYEIPLERRDLEAQIKGTYTRPEGMHWLDDGLQDDQLLQRSGLTRQDAYNLLKSYAYAENSQYLRRIGSEALYRLIDAHVVPKRRATSG